MVYKYKNNKEDASFTCCPYGCIRDTSAIECYHYGIVTREYCRNCSVRKDNKVIRKSGE